MRFLLLGALQLVCLAQATENSVFPLVPASTVALLRFSGLRTAYNVFAAGLNATLRSSSLSPGTVNDFFAAFPLTLDGLLPPSLPNLRTIDLDQPFFAAVLLHASGNLSAPFVPGFLAAPHPALLLLLPGVSLLHLAQLPGMEPAHDGSPYHYRSADAGPSVCISLGSHGSTGLLAVGLQFYDLTAPPTAGFVLPSGAVTTMRASAISLALELSQLDVLLRPLLLAGPSILTLLETSLGTVLEFSHLKAELQQWGLTTSMLGSVSAIFRELLELALALLGDMRAVVLSARLQGTSALHLGLHACFRNGSSMAKSAALAPAATTASLWPSLPALSSIMLAGGDALSPAAVAEFEARVFGPALAHLDRATQGATLSPTAALLRDLLTLMRSLNGPADSVQVALVNNGAGDPAHPNTPPHSGADAPTRYLAPGVVALFARGNTVEDVWQRHAVLLSALRLATGPGLPWARTRSRSEQALLSASGGATLAAAGAAQPAAPGTCGAQSSCRGCNDPSLVCMWCGASGACVDYISSYDLGGRAKVCSDAETLVLSCPEEPPATRAPAAPGTCGAQSSCRDCNSDPSMMCMWCGASGTCMDYILSSDVDERAKVCSETDTLVASSYFCPEVPPATQAEPPATRAPAAPGNCSAQSSCRDCNSYPYLPCMWCGASGTCMDYRYISSGDVGERAKVCSDPDTLVASSYSCPEVPPATRAEPPATRVEPPATQAELTERFVRVVDVEEAVSNRTIGGIQFENRRIVLTWREGPMPMSLEVDTAVGMVGERVLAFSLLSDAAVLPFVQAALTPTAVPLFSDLPSVNASFLHLPRNRSNVLALRLAPLEAYFTSLQLRSGDSRSDTEKLEHERLSAVLEQEGATVGLTFNPTGENGATPAGMEVFVDLNVRAVQCRACPSRLVACVAFSPLSHLFPPFTTPINIYLLPAHHQGIC